MEGFSSNYESPQEILDSHDYHSHTPEHLEHHVVDRIDGLVPHGEEVGEAMGDVCENEEALLRSLSPSSVVLAVVVSARKGCVEDVHLGNEGCRTAGAWRWEEDTLHCVLDDARVQRDPNRVDQGGPADPNCRLVPRGGCGLQTDEA